MASINIGDAQREELLKLPETGMGFQLVEARLEGALRRFLVWNATTALDLSFLDLQASDSPSVIMANEERIIEAANREEMTLLMAPGPRSFRLLGTRVGSGPQPTTTARIAATPSSLVKHVTLTAPRAFHRFSAFNPDRRVDPKTGDFIPGTYAVPESELPFIPTGFAAVGRCALPNTQPASHHYSLRAVVGTRVSFGTVAPAFGQSGGGVEAFFASGAVNQPPLVAPKP
jgi:hypothetical protein